MDEKRLRKVLERIRVAKVSRQWLSRIRPTVNIVLIPLLSHPGFRDPGANIITRCAGTKSHTYDESWYRNECHIFTI
jgi:hypothetical protein